MKAKAKAILGEKAKAKEPVKVIYFSFTAKGKTTSGNTWKLKGHVKGRVENGREPSAEEAIISARNAISAAAPHLVPTELNIKRLKGKPA